MDLACLPTYADIPHGTAGGNGRAGIMSTAGITVLFVAALVVMTALTTWSVRTVVRSNQRLLDDLAALRAETLEAFRGAQREENARLVADTRAATAKMNAMADALWSGLQETASS